LSTNFCSMLNFSKVLHYENNLGRISLLEATFSSDLIAGRRSLGRDLLLSLLPGLAEVFDTLLVVLGRFRSVVL
jgi:hypothetical protein